MVLTSKESVGVSLSTDVPCGETRKSDWKERMDYQMVFGGSVLMNRGEGYNLSQTTLVSVVRIIVSTQTSGFVDEREWVFWDFVSILRRRRVYLFLTIEYYIKWKFYTGINTVSFINKKPVKRFHFNRYCLW